MMSGAKAPDFDACGLLRATHSHNPWHHNLFLYVKNVFAVFL